jgi:hypothetical protein
VDIEEQHLALLRRDVLLEDACSTASV